MDQVQAFDPTTKLQTTQTVQKIFINHDTDLIDVTLTFDPIAKATTNVVSGTTTPCSGVLGCNQMLPHMLPEGANLTVYFKDELNGINNWAIRGYTGLPDSSWKWPPF